MNSFKETEAFGDKKLYSSCFEVVSCSEPSLHTAKICKLRLKSVKNTERKDEEINKTSFQMQVKSPKAGKQW